MDTREVSIPPEVFDAIALEHDASPHYHAEPTHVPDHGSRPRPPKRPSVAAYDADRANLYRPKRDSYFTRSLYDDDPGPSKEGTVIRLLAETAREHAPRLARYSKVALGRRIEDEILPDARFIASSLPEAVQGRVLAKFREVLRSEIEFHRKYLKITHS